MIKLRRNIGDASLRAHKILDCLANGVPLKTPRNALKLLAILWRAKADGALGPAKIARDRQGFQPILTARAHV
jgi:hypothetical protein